GWRGKKGIRFGGTGNEGEGALCPFGVWGRFMPADTIAVSTHSAVIDRRYNPPSVRVAHFCQGRCERALPCLKVNMQLFEQTTHSRVLEEYEFCFADHDLLMAVPHLVCIVRPVLRSLRPHDVHSFRLLLHLDDCLLRREDEIVTGLQDGPRG